MRALGLRLGTGFITTVVVFLLGVGHLAAQSPELEVIDFAVEGRDVSLTVVAPDELRGDTVGPASFPITINDEVILPSVRRIEGDQLDVVLAIDVSGSMSAEALDAAKNSAIALITELPDTAEVAIVAFGDQARVEQPFTADRDQSAAAILSLDAGGETALYAGVSVAAQLFDRSGDASRSVVLLSDGGNTVDVGSLTTAQVDLGLSDAVLYAISIETNEANPAELDALAATSGGTVSRVENLDEVGQLYTSLGANIGNQYRLTFRALGSGLTQAVIDAQRLEDSSTVASTSISLGLPLVVPAEPFATPTAIVVPPTPVPQSVTATPPASVTVEAESNVALKWLSIGAVGTAIAAIVLILAAPRSDRPASTRPSQRFSAPRTQKQATVTRVVSALSGLVDRGLAGGGIGPWLSNLLDTAGWKIRNSEFVLLTGLVAATLFMAGGLRSFTLGLSLAACVLAAVWLLLLLLANRRRAAFDEQLNGTLQMMAGALRTGYSLPQVFALVAQEAESPTSDEFSRVVTETRLGRDLVEASEGVATRMKSSDFGWTTGALDISRDVGGDLAEVLDNVATTIRTRGRIHRQVMALSAEGRISAWILMVLPFPLFFWQLFVNREYTMLLFNNRLGRTIFITSVAMLVTGAIWMQRIIKVRY